MESEQHLLFLDTLDLIKIIQDLKDENERLNSALKTIAELTNCEKTLYFASRTLERKEKIKLPYRFNI